MSPEAEETHPVASKRGKGKGKGKGGRCQRQAGCRQMEPPSCAVVDVAEGLVLESKRVMGGVSAFKIPYSRRLYVYCSALVVGSVEGEGEGEGEGEERNNEGEALK